MHTYVCIKIIAPIQSMVILYIIHKIDIHTYMYWCMCVIIKI